MKRQYYLMIAVIAALALVIVGCGSDEGDNGAATGAGGSSPSSANVSGSVSVMGIWQGGEQKKFQQVLDGFTSQYPNVTVKYNGVGDNLPTVLSTAVEGGKPPDIAFVAQPGLMKDFVSRGVIKPIEFARGVMEDNLTPDAVKLGEVDGKLYGMLYKGANKSTLWYNVHVLNDAGVEPPQTWDDVFTAADTIQASGVPAFSFGAGDGWTLTDIFENIYLRTAGPDKYDQLADHEIPWTDQSVKDALTQMGRLFENQQNIAGGTAGALQADMPSSVANLFTDPPKAAIVLLGDFVPTAISDAADVQPETDYNVVPFPSVSGENVVVGGGDTAVVFNDTEAAQALIQYLATSKAAEIWAKLGGFSSPNTNVNPDVYPDEITRTTATALASAETFRFDMSDLAPSAFGGTAGQGEWKILQDFFKDPGDVDGTAQALEQAASKAYGNQ